MHELRLDRKTDCNKKSADKVLKNWENNYKRQKSSRKSYR